MKLPFSLLALCLLTTPAPAADLVFAVSTGSAMPMTDVRDGVLTGGLLKDFGDALAHEMKMSPSYALVPRKRVEETVRSGQADLVCDLRPEWVDSKDWEWTATVFTNHMIVAQLDGMRPVTRARDLMNVRVGTILGYRYPELEAVLGKRFVRDETANDSVNLDKLLHHRFDYMLTNALFYDFQRISHPYRWKLSRKTYEIVPFDTFCGMAPGARVRLADVNHAIATLRRQGELQTIMDRYRPPR